MTRWMQIYQAVVMCLVLAIGVCAFAGDEKLPQFRVTYLEFPPYYYTNAEGLPDGFLLKKTDALLRAAGVEPVFESRSADRALLEVRGPKPVCSIGWFKTDKRVKYAQFSKSIYRNQSLHVVYLKSNGAKFRGKDSLSSLMRDGSLSIGLLGSYSYGGDIDDMIADVRPVAVPINGGQPQLVRSLAAGLFDYMLAAPEEIGILIDRNRLSPDLFVIMRPVDMPPGNKRHLMFSRSVPQELINRVNAEIDKR